MGIHPQLCGANGLYKTSCGDVDAGDCDASSSLIKPGIFAYSLLTKDIFCEACERGRNQSIMFTFNFVVFEDILSTVLSIQVFLTYLFLVLLYV